jgi:hypothetical protein
VVVAARRHLINGCGHTTLAHSARVRTYGVRVCSGLSLSEGRPRRSSLGVLKGTVDVLQRSISLASPSAAPTLHSQYGYVSSTDVSMKRTFTEEYRSRGMSGRLSACAYSVYQALFSPSPSRLEPRLRPPMKIFSTILVVPHTPVQLV